MFGQVHRLRVALMEERVEVRLADELRQLVVGAEIGGGQRGERHRVELRLLADGRHQLPRAVHEQRAARVALEEELLERGRDRPEIVFA